jgi:enoyl-CoA hydratase/carnithine racemase
MGADGSGGVAAAQGDFETIIVEVADHVATVTLNRPKSMNSFNQKMLDEFSRLWTLIREDDDVRVIVLRAAGDRAFCTGADIKEHIYFHPNMWTQLDPAEHLSPKMHKVWKPLVAAVHGLAAGGAFYWLNEADLIICSDDAQFFEPHVTYGRTAALEPIGLTYRMPLGEVLRMALLGNDERMSAQTALKVGLVTEVLPREELWDRAAALAAQIALKPPIAVQGTVRAIWESLDSTRSTAVHRALAYTQISNPMGSAEVDPAAVGRKWELR